ncbi:MAG: mechanosensitive ion channel family protein [Betaproteobacteria bacterium]
MDAVLEHLQRLDVTQWSGSGVIALRVAAIAVVAWILTAILGRAIRLMRARIASRLHDQEQVRRAQTIERVLRYLATVVVTLIAVVLILSELGVSVAPILGAAGVVGLAVGFGAQSLVKDYFNGFFLLLENQLTTGDVVKVADRSGVVEDVTLRFVRLRDYDGNVHFIPNNLISTVTNMSRGFANAVMDIGVAYRENTDDVVAVMREVGAAMRSDDAWGKRILGDLDVAGVDRWDDSAVVIRCRFKVMPLEQWATRREFLRRLKLAFDERGIEIPFPHVTLYAGVDKQGSAPPLRVVAEGVAGSTGDGDAEPPRRAADRGSATAPAV